MVVRATDQGRRGFASKTPGKMLAFEGADGQIIYRKRVGPAMAQFWTKAGFETIKHKFAALRDKIGPFKAKALQAGDVMRANAPHIDGYNPRGKPKQRAKPVTE